MLKQSIGMTENNAKQIAEMYLSRYNPTYWDGSGKVPSEVIFEICRVAVDSMYNGCTLDIQLCKIDACPCYAASIHLFEGGFWTGHGIGCFDKTALCYDIGSVHSLASAIMRICATYENLTNFRKVFVERLVISKERMNEIKQYTDGGKKQDEIEFESVTFADGMCHGCALRPAQGWSFVVRGCYLLRGRRCCHIRAVQFVLQSLGLPDGKRHLPSLYGRCRYRVMVDALCELRKLVTVCFLFCRQRRRFHMYIRNLTPHSVTVAGITIEPSGIVARVSAATADAGSVDFNGTTIPLTTTVYGEVQNLPAQRDDTLLIVSSLVAARCKDRTDVFIPNEPIRDAEGRIVGCQEPRSRLTAPPLRQHLPPERYRY